MHALASFSTDYVTGSGYSISACRTDDKNKIIILKLLRRYYLQIRSNDHKRNYNSTSF